MKLIRKLVTGLMILLVALGSSPLEAFANVTYNPPDQTKREWPTQHYNGDVATTLPPPPAPKNIVDLNQMFNYPILDYSGLPGNPDPRWNETFRPEELKVIKSLKGYVPDNNSTPNGDSSVAVITRDAPWQAGVMWSRESNKINLAEPFHMISYVYLGSRGQADKNADDNKRAGADGITFTIHNDKKKETLSDDERKVLAGHEDNHGMNAYGALGNGLGVYGSNFSANTATDYNNMADMRQGVTNGIALEFDTFYNHNNTTQHSDNDLWKFVGKEGDPNSNFGHIGINYLNDLQYNRANEDTLTGTSKHFSKHTYSDTTMIKHRDMLSVGWNGYVGDLSSTHGWMAQVTDKTQPLADGMWHRLEVEWEPTNQTTGKLTYRIYQQGYSGQARAVTTLTPTTDDGNSIIEKTLDIDVTTVFAVPDVNSTVYWGFSGSTGYYQNNQAVQMLQLPKAYYQSEILKEDQDGNPVSGARFKIEKWNETTKEWEVQKIYNPDPETPPETPGDGYTLETGSQEEGIEEEVYKGVSQSLGKIKLTQLTAGTYRWKEVAAPEGYEKAENKEYYPDEKGFDVNLGESKKLENPENPIFTTTAKNKKLYQLELTKKNSETQGAIDGVPFIISKTENDKRYYLKLNADSKGFVWTEVEADAEKFLSGKYYALDENGKISGQDGDEGKLIVKYFPDAPNLSWKEVEVPKGYDSSGTLTGDFAPSTDNKYVYSATQTNSRLYQVSLEKIASDTKAPLSGAEFSLEQLVGSEWKAVGDDKTTDKYGKITISNLKAGKYRWKEVKAPDGYKINKQYHPDENGFEVKYRKGLEIDEISQNYKYDLTEVTNDRNFELTLEKLSSTSPQEPLKGVVFNLYDSAGGTDFSTLDPIATVTTDADGKIFLKNGQIQADKTYYLVETKAAEGFIALKGYFKVVTSKTDGIKVSYESDGETDESSVFNLTSTSAETDVIYSGHLTIYNKRRELILPNTGGIGTLAFTLVGGAIMTGTALVGRKKKKEEE